MTFYKDLCDDGQYSFFGYEDIYGFGGLNGCQFGSPQSYYRDLYHYGGPNGYRSFGNQYGRRGFTSYGGFYGQGDLYGLGYTYPFSSRFGNRFNF